VCRYANRQLMVVVFQQDILHRGQRPSAMLNLKHLSCTWLDRKVVIKNRSENCKMAIFIVGILSSDIGVINRRRRDRRESSEVLYI
jgi:hypothetical protein